jgi:hypothetical protein
MELLLSCSGCTSDGRATLLGCGFIGQGRNVTTTGTGGGRPAK